MNKVNRSEDENPDTTVDKSAAEGSPEPRESRESGSPELDQQDKAIEELQNEVAELRDTYLRKVAELDNVKKRTERERIQMYESAKIATIEDFLPIHDDIQRTIQAMADSSAKDISVLEDGVKLIGNKFEEVLRRYQIERIDQTGVPFDVELHDALMTKKPEDENTDSNTVLHVLESGYRMGNRTIRHAKVVVSE